MEDQVLEEGSGANRGRIVKSGQSVVRPAGPHTVAVHALLRHLRALGFAGAPEPVRLDNDNEVLTFISGDVPVPPQPPDGGWPVTSDESLLSVARLLLDFHNASATFDPPPDAKWQGGAPTPFDGTLICHNDPVVGNIVFAQHEAIALIDFDYAGPSDPIWDLAIVAQHWIPLADPTDFVETADDWSSSTRLRSLCNGYGLAEERLPRLLDAVEMYLERGRLGVQRRVEGGEPAFVAYWAAGLGDRLQRALAWLRRERSTLLG